MEETSAASQSNDASPEEEKPVKKQSSSARARAEARRRRILESSKNRMEMVSGNVATTTTTTTPTTATEATTSEEVDNSEVVRDSEAKTEEKTTETTSYDEEVKKTTSSRLQQMRRRRFQKSSAAKASPATAKSEEKDSVPDSEAPKTSTNEKEFKQNEQSNDEPSSTDLSNDKPKESQTSTAEEKVTESSTAPSVQSIKTEKEEGAEPEKKYLGVARMRRKMLSEKKKQTTTQEAPVKTIPKHVLEEETSNKSTFSIVLHLLTTLLIFSFGIQLGYQQQPFLSNDAILVETALRKSHVVSLVYAPPPSSIKEEIMVDDSPPLDIDDIDNPIPILDEFSESLPAEPQSSNIDPLFNVDLDELTKEPTFLNSIARMAISIHRSIIYFPLHFFQMFLCTPYFFILALLLRRSSRFLGGTLPEPPEPEEESTDVLLTIIKTAKAFVSSVIPGLGILGFLYEVYREVKDDVLVILCGFLFGLVGFAVKTEVGTDEL